MGNAICKKCSGFGFSLCDMYVLAIPHICIIALQPRALCHTRPVCLIHAIAAAGPSHGPTLSSSLPASPLRARSVRGATCIRTQCCCERSVSMVCILSCKIERICLPSKNNILRTWKLCTCKYKVTRLVYEVVVSGILQ